MVSGIVYFSEVVENLKDVTGIENMRPLYPRIRRWIMNAEDQIGAGGVQVLKTKNYTKGDSFYDGNRLVLPEDFRHEWSEAALIDGRVQGNTFKLFDPGPDDITFYYIGFLTDNEGNPFTTRNRLDAIISYCVMRMYSSKYFQGVGNAQQYRIYQDEFNREVMRARGLDAFPSEEEWKEIGAILKGGVIRAMTDCGMQSVYLGTNNPSSTNDITISEDVVCIGDLSGIVNTETTTSTILGFVTEILEMEGIINTRTETRAVITINTDELEQELQGTINTGSTVSGTLYNAIVFIQCTDTYIKQLGDYVPYMVVHAGSGVGTTGILFTPFNIPKRVRIHYNGVEVANSKFVGNNDYQQQLIDLGYTLGEMDLTETAPFDLPVTFFKSTSAPLQFEVFIDNPIGGGASEFNISGVCPSGGYIAGVINSGSVVFGSIKSATGGTVDLTAFYIDITGYETGALSCGAMSGNTGIRFHNGDEAYPTVGDTVYLDQEGQYIYNGENKWYKLQNNKTIRITSQGLIMEEVDCA